MIYFSMDVEEVERVVTGQNMFSQMEKHCDFQGGRFKDQNVLQRRRL